MIDYLFMYLFMYSFIYLLLIYFIYLFILLSGDPTRQSDGLRLFTCLFACLSVRLSLHLSVFPSIYLSMQLYLATICGWLFATYQGSQCLSEAAVTAGCRLSHCFAGGEHCWLMRLSADTGLATSTKRFRCGKVAVF